MATYFGELVEKPSRAFWIDDYDSEDGDYLEVYNRKLEITSLRNRPTQNARKDKLFLVIHGPLIEGFVEACVVDGECAAEIKEIDDVSYGRKKKSKSTVHYLTNEVSLCICDADLDITQAFDFTEKLSPWMKNTEQVMVLTCNHLSEYYGVGVQNDQDMFVRALKTNYYNNPVLSEALEQPNTLKGIPAAILTWCQISRVPAVAYVCFTRSFEMDSCSVKPFSQLISRLPFKLLKEKPDFTHKTYNKHKVSSNVYM